MSKGKRIKSFPLHMVYLPVAHSSVGDPRVKIAVSAPKRIHRKAVDRNALKRKIRALIAPLIPEIEGFIEETGTAYVCMLIYVGSEIQSTTALRPRINHLLQRFKEECNIHSTDEQIEEGTE